MSKHLSLSDRAIIEKYLAQDFSFSYIAKRLSRSPSTISREVKNHRCFVNGSRYTDNDCLYYGSSHCSLLDKPPYVCTCCSEEKTCKRNHAYYTAHRANAEYTKLLSSSRKGLRTAPDKLLEINDLIAPLIYNGQSINHIFASHAKEIGLSERTIYN